MELFESLLNEHKKELNEGNAITSALSEEVNEFLMDLSQMYDDAIYSAVLDKKEYTEDEIKSLEGAASSYFEAAEEMDDFELDEFVVNTILPIVYDALSMVQ